MKSSQRSVSPLPARTTAARLLQAIGAALALGSGVAHAESAKLSPQQPVALFVDVAENQIPEVGALKPRKFDLHGLPVLLGSGPSNDIGVQAGHTAVLGGGYSLEGRASMSRSAASGAMLPTSHGMNEAMGGVTARLRQGGWDIAVFPEISTAHLDASRLPSYVLGGSVTRAGPGGWAVEAASRYAIRRTGSADASAGATASGQFGFADLRLFGAKVDLDYAYDWRRPDVATATLSHGPSATLDLALSDALQCRVAYRYEFAGDLRGVAPGFAWLGDGGQDLSIGWDWDLVSEGMRGATLRADFAYHQDFFASAAPAEGSGGLNIATAF